MDAENNTDAVTDVEEAVEIVGDAAGEAITETPEELEEQARLEEQAARARGWKPKDKYTKSPDTWVDARTFLRRGEAYQKNMQAEMDKLRAEIAELNETKVKFAEHYEEILKRRDDEFKATIAALKTQRNEAIRSADDDEAQLLEDQIEALRQAQAELAQKKAKAAEGTGKKQQDAQTERLNQEELKKWVGRGNTWFVADSELGAYALKVAQELRNAGDTSVHQEFLDKIAARVRADFPHKFTQSTQQKVSGERSTASSGVAGKSKRDLPQADRELMELYVRQGLTTEAKFLKSYFG